jgi:hypothetical protein
MATNANAYDHSDCNAYAVSIDTYTNSNAHGYGNCYTHSDSDGNSHLNPVSSRRLDKLESKP